MYWPGKLASVDEEACIMEVWTVNSNIVRHRLAGYILIGMEKSWGEATDFLIETRSFLERLHTRATKRNFECSMLAHVFI